MAITKSINEPGWQSILRDVCLAPFYASIFEAIDEQKKMGKSVFPTDELVFNALNLTPFDQVKVIILGQDPYPTRGHACGLSFSVPEGVAIPRSLKNIFKEIETDLQLTPPTSGNLEKWAKQGVLLLNTTLTVNEGEPNSHAAFGWQLFTDEVITQLANKKSNLVFMLWGNFAQSKSKLIDEHKHLVLKSAHPSPLSVKGFWGCKHFSKANSYLLQNGKTAIDWRLA